MVVGLFVSGCVICVFGRLWKIDCDWEEERIACYACLYFCCDELKILNRYTTSTTLRFRARSLLEKDSVGKMPGLFRRVQGMLLKGATVEADVADCFAFCSEPRFAVRRSPHAPQELQIPKRGPVVYIEICVEALCTAPVESITSMGSKADIRV